LNRRWIKPNYKAEVAPPTKLTLAHRAELQAVQLANDIKVLMHWLSHDILALAGPSLEERQELFDFIVAELSQRESQLPHRLRPRTALKINGMTC